jgi:ankyrin repeat protein
MWGNSPAILAAQYGHAELLRLLIDKGADVAGSNDGGATVLLFACLEGFDPDLIKLVISKGAPLDPGPARVYNARADCHARLTPLVAAAVNGHLEILTLLVDAGASVDRAVLPVLGLAEETPNPAPMGATM